MGEVCVRSDEEHVLRRQVVTNMYENVRTLVIQRVAAWRLDALIRAWEMSPEHRLAYVERVDEEYHRQHLQVEGIIGWLAEKERYHVYLLEVEKAGRT